MQSVSTPGDRQGWLFSPAPDLLFGCGAAYLLLVGLHLSTGTLLESWIPGGVLILLFSLPHYGATLLRVYESAADRTRYRFFAVHTSVLLVVLLGLSTHTVLLGSLLLTLYLTWSPWHYTGQNYGIALILARRRGVEVSPSSKRWLQLSFIFSYAVAFLAMHGTQADATYAPAPYGTGGIRMMSLGIPGSFAYPAMLLAGTAYLVAVVGALAQLGRGGSFRALAPAALLVLTQSVWFVVPVFLRLSGMLANAPGAASPFSSYGFLWVASAHAVQYLWITVYYAAASGSGARRSAFLGKAALAGFAVWTVPGLIFAPSLLGATTYDSGLALLVASVVNLHHFILDGAIWKLRDGRIARVLLRTVPVRPEASTPRDRWVLRWACWVAGVLSIGIALVGFWESEFGFQRALAAGNLERAEVAIERFSWLGRDGAAKRVRVARELATLGDYERAEVQLQRAVALEPSAVARHLLGLVREHQLRWREALAEYDAALALDPGNDFIRERRSAVRIELGDLEGAIEELEDILARDPGQDRARALLVRARLALRVKRTE